MRPDRESMVGKSRDCCRMVVIGMSILLSDDVLD